MRTLGIVFSILVVLAFVGVLGILGMQNPQTADWTLFGQSVSVSGGIAIAAAAIAGFLLAVVFSLPFIGAPAATARAAQYQRDLTASREQYRQLQAEQSRLQASYAETTAERDHLRAQQASAPTTTLATPAQPVAPAPVAEPSEPQLQQLPVLTDLAVPQANVQAPAAPQRSYLPYDVAATPSSPAEPTRPAPTDTRTDMPPARQVIRPDGTIVGSGEEATPPPAENAPTTPLMH